jgi:hypothetical protein
MTTSRSFAPWVQRAAGVLAEDAAEVLAFVEQAPVEFWAQTSVVAGWTNRDILAHMGGGNDQMVQTVLRAVVDGVELDASALNPNTDAENTRRVAERRAWPFEQVLLEYETGVDELQNLLAKLLAEHERVPLAGGQLTPGALLRIVQHERHDHMHLEQLRAGLRS